MERQIQYDNRIIAFIDILAFSNLLKKTQFKDDEGSVVDDKQFITRVYSVFKRIRELMSVDEMPEGAAASRRVTQFSDSIVVSFKLSDEPVEFKYLLGELLHLTTELIKNDILIRGGISYGALIHTQKVLFGPAMTQAYMVESKAAVSPRIILPKSLYDKDGELKKALKEEETTNYELNDFLTRDEDDFYYLDYFEKCQNPDLMIFSSDDEYIVHLKKLKEIITEGLRIREPGIYSKYGWMKTKWNRTVEKFKCTQAQKQLIADKRSALAEYFKNETLIVTSM